jgi:hypothetical protein
VDWTGIQQVVQSRELGEDRAEYKGYLKLKVQRTVLKIPTCSFGASEDWILSECRQNDGFG